MRPNARGKTRWLDSAIRERMRNSDRIVARNHPQERNVSGPVAINGTPEGLNSALRVNEDRRPLAESCRRKVGKAPKIYISSEFSGRRRARSRWGAAG
jgi:hypothetical protein